MGEKAVTIRGCREEANNSWLEKKREDSKVGKKKEKNGKKAADWGVDRGEIKPLGLG